MPDTNNQRRKGLFWLNFRHFGPWLAVALCLSCGEAQHYGRKGMENNHSLLGGQRPERDNILYRQILGQEDSSVSRVAYCATLRTWVQIPAPTSKARLPTDGSTETGISWSLLAWWTKQVMRSRISERPWTMWKAMEDKT